MRTIMLVLLTSGCWQTAPSAENPAAIHPLACGDRPCTTDAQCADIFSSCRVCFLGSCTNALPAQPISDAGVGGSP